MRKLMSNKLKVKYTQIILAFLSIVFTINAHSYSRDCSLNDFQACKSCGDLQRAIDLNRPDFGDFYRGALWNGLFSAYVNNCPKIAEQLIENDASPVSGGSGGSMILTIANKWPHNNIEVNLRWAAMLKKNGVNIYTPLIFQGFGYNTVEVMENHSSETYYKDILKMFIDL